MINAWAWKHNTLKVKDSQNTRYTVRYGKNYNYWSCFLLDEWWSELICLIFCGKKNVKNEKPRLLASYIPISAVEHLWVPGSGAVRKLDAVSWMWSPYYSPFPTIFTNVILVVRFWPRLIQSKQQAVSYEQFQPQTIWYVQLRMPYKECRFCYSTSMCKNETKKRR